jgi:hypothetical protein
MNIMNQEEGRYRVLLIGIRDNTEEKKKSFCKNVSEKYGISLPLLKKIVNRCPIILKKNLNLKNAETLAKILKSFGALVSVEQRRGFPPVFLEFQEMGTHWVALESSYVRRTQSGRWYVIGRVKNISEEGLHDIWVLIQLFDNIEEFFTFEEVPISINPLPPGESSPFKAIFDIDLPIKKVSIAFKNSSGSPLPALDERKKMEWVEVEIEEDNGEFPSFALAPLIGEERPQEEIFTEKGLDNIKEDLQTAEAEIPSPLVEKKQEIEVESREKVLEETPLLKPEDLSSEIKADTPEKNIDIPMMVMEEDGKDRREEQETSLYHEVSQQFTLPILEKGEIEEEGVSLELGAQSDQREDLLKEMSLDTSLFEQATPLLEEISERTNERKEKGSPPFTWLEDFKNSVETYYQKTIDHFSMWFNAQKIENGFEHDLHSLLVILAHARFDQMSQLEKALENTKKIFKLFVQPNIALEEIPLLEGTKFLSGENWRDLFYKAIPKLQQIARNIIEKKKWNAQELERLIQIIPHMGEKNSKETVRWINQLIPDVVEIDFSNTSLSIGEGLYRVASRLGVLDPHFDYYQGNNSVGDLKIQSFAKAAFPQYPTKIEDPMTRMGMKEEEGGHCFPTQPRCEGCLFESFCQKLYFQFNPSEKGMREP